MAKESETSQKLAPHVRAAIAAHTATGTAGQPRQTEQGQRPLASHVRTAIGAAQAKAPGAAAPLVAHVQAAIGVTQPRAPGSDPGQAAHVQAATGAAQAKARDVAPQVAAHVRAAIGVAQAKVAAQPVSRSAAPEALVVQAMEEDEEYFPPEVLIEEEKEEKKEKKKLEKKENRKRRREDSDEDEDDSDFSLGDDEDYCEYEGYIDGSTYVKRFYDEWDRSPSGESHYDNIFVNDPGLYGAKSRSILFKPGVIRDKKWAKVSGKETETKNLYNKTLSEPHTWHHTSIFNSKKECLMQLVPTRIHSKIKHIGGAQEARAKARRKKKKKTK